MTAMGRVGEFFSRIVPVSKAASTAMAMFGFGEDEHRLEVSRRAYWRFVFEEDIKLPGRGGPGKGDVESRDFQRAMTRAPRAIRWNN